MILQFITAPDPELHVHGIEVVPDRPDREAQSVGDVLVGSPLRGHPRDLELPRRQRLWPTYPKGERFSSLAGLPKGEGSGHVRYAEHQALIAIADGRVIAGRLPRRALRLVREWMALHLPELRSNWERARAGEAVVPIAPLP